MILQLNMKIPVCPYEHAFLMNHLLSSPSQNAKPEESILIYKKHLGSHLSQSSYNYHEL